MRRSWQHGFAFSRARRSGGRQALQLPRASNSRGSSNIHLRSDRVPQKLELYCPYLLIIDLKKIKTRVILTYNLISFQRHAGEHVGSEGEGCLPSDQDDRLWRK